MLGIVTVGDIISPSGASDQAYNGFKIYLSSPRHADSGSRGECMNPGYQENVNGRQWNWRAANGTYYGVTYSPSVPERNIHGRGFKANISPNTKDGGFLDNQERSRNWGSDLHIITHTNALNGCEESTNYLLGMWQTDNDAHDDYDIAAKMVAVLDPVAPGSGVVQQRTNLAELSTNAPYGDGYMELVFHSRQASQTWIHDQSYQYAYLYGRAIDEYLGYPG